MISVPGQVSSCVGTGKPVASQHRGVEAVQGGRRGPLVTHPSGCRAVGAVVFEDIRTIACD